MATAAPRAHQPRPGRERGPAGECSQLDACQLSAACAQDRDGGRGILRLLHGTLASVSLVYADGGYQGRLGTLAKSAWGIVLEIVRKPAD
jgi:hypothetical protein